MSALDWQTQLQEERSINKRYVAVSDKSESGKEEEEVASRVEFPRKLYQLLEDAEQDSNDRAIVSWLPCGQAFQIHNKIKFETKIMPKYFKTASYKSFHRNLNLWGYETTRKGFRKGAKSNPLFVRGHPDRCFHMKRSKLKKSKFTESRDMMGPAAPTPSFVSHDLPTFTSHNLSRTTSGSPEAAMSNLDTFSKLLFLNKLDVDLARHRQNTRTAQDPQLRVLHPPLVQAVSPESFTSVTLHPYHSNNTPETTDFMVAAVLEVLMRGRGVSLATDP